MSLRGGAAADVSKMKIGELQSALKARGLPSSGVKSDLAKRLQEHMDQDADNAEMDSMKRPLPLDRTPVDDDAAKRPRSEEEEGTDVHQSRGNQATPVPPSPPKLTAKVLVDSEEGGLVRVLYCFNIKDKLRKAGFSFDKESKAWTFPAQLMADKLQVGSPKHITQEAVLRLVEQEHLMDLDAIPGVSTAAAEADASLVVAVADGMVRVTGNTYPFRDKLRSAGFRWDAASQSWGRPEESVQEALAAAGLPAECTQESVTTMIETTEIVPPQQKNDEAAAPKPPPEILVQGEEVHVTNSYDIKDELRKIGFHWNTETKGWARNAQEVLSLLSLSSPTDITVDALLDAAKAVAPTPPSLTIDGGMVLVRQSYNVKEELKAAGFQWDKDASAWTMPIDSAKTLCGADDESGVTVESVVEASAKILEQNGGAAAKAASPSAPAKQAAEPSIRVVDGQIQVLNSYSVKESLKALSFQWSVEDGVWTHPAADVVALLGVESEAQVTVALLVNAAKNAPAKANVARPEAYVTCTNEDALVFNGYDVKDRLKSLGFRWDGDKGAWTKPLQELLSNLGVEGEENVTMEAILKKCDQAGPPPPRDTSFVQQAQKSPQVVVNDADKTVRVLNSYSVKDDLKELAFQYDQEAKYWYKGIADVKTMLGLSDQSDVTLDLLLAKAEEVRTKGHAIGTEGNVAAFLQRSPSPGRTDTNPGDQLEQLSSMGNSAQGHAALHSPHRTPSAVH